jgi:hypothetical protein
MGGAFEVYEEAKKRAEMKRFLKHRKYLATFT